jgi:hypothetical protein
MPDRHDLLTYVGLLLRRMDELSKSMPKSKQEMERTRLEASRLQKRWRACMRMLNHHGGKGSSHA